jgi:predicted Kef-type K+ transport protein
MTAAWISCALLLGLAARYAGLPPLVGFLAAGFVLRALGAETTPLLDEVAHAGVLLLLFAVGLKLRLKTFFRHEVWGTSIVHLAVTVGVTLLVLQGRGMPWSLAVALGLALGFSSTVFAAKALEEKRELRAVHGRLAIGILIVQDVIAVAVLAFLSVTTPSPYAVLLLLLPFLRPVLGRVLNLVGHGELLVLFGVVLAIAVGGFAFESLGISPELGALVLGMTLTEHERAQELSSAIWSLKEFFLIGFFLTIGLDGVPTWTILGHSAWLALLLPVKAVLFFLLLLALGLRARTSFLTAVALSTYSEFGLIVVGVAVDNGLLAPDWLLAAAIAVGFSFAIAAPFNAFAHPLYSRLDAWLVRLERNKRHPDDEPVSLGSAEILIVGMGRVGSAAYDYFHECGEPVVGADSDPAKLEANRRAGRRVVYADAEDASFWHQLNIEPLRAVLLALPDLEAKERASRELRRRGYKGFLSATHVFDEERAPILAAGCDVTYNYFTEAGVGLARDSLEALQGRQPKD